MPIHALDAIDEAVGPTRSLVSRLGVPGWLKLGAITLFVGGIGSISFSANLPNQVLRSLSGGVLRPIDLERAVGTVLVAVVVAISLSAFYLLRSILEFTFYTTIRDGTVSVRQSVRRWWLYGAQVWALRVVVAAVLLGGGTTLASAITADGGHLLGAENRALVVVTLACSYGVYALIAGLTTRFVVPIMLIDDSGVLASWRRFLRTVGNRPGQYVWYLIVGPFVRFVADVLALSAAVLLAVLLAVPVAIFVLPAIVVLGERPELALSPPLIMLTTGLSAGYVIAAIAGALLARMPFVVYVRTYALSVLRRTDPALDLFASAVADDEESGSVFDDERAPIPRQ